MIGITEKNFNVSKGFPALRAVFLAASRTKRTPLPYEMRSLGYPAEYDLRGTTQGGPRSEGRSCGTGGDLAYF
jgi:hypothetical protein